MVERTDWDVIVIGGGPAGSTVARYVAEGGKEVLVIDGRESIGCLLYTSPSPRDVEESRMPSSA